MPGKQMRSLKRYIQAFLNKLGINFNFSLTTKAGSIHNTGLMDETREQETRVEDRPWALRPGDKNLSCDTSRKNSATLPMVQRRWSPGPWARPSAAASASLAAGNWDCQHFRHSSVNSRLMLLHHNCLWQLFKIFQKLILLTTSFIPVHNWT